MKKNLSIPIALFLTIGQIVAQKDIYEDVVIHTDAGSMTTAYNIGFHTGFIVTPRATPSDNFQFIDNMTWAGAVNAAHVNGYVQKIGDDAFVFPTGNGTVLEQIGISAPPSVSAVYKAAYFRGSAAAATLPAGAPFNTTIKASSISAVSTVGYWDLDGANSVNVTLYWNSNSDLVGLTNTLADLRVVGWDGSQWVDLGNTAITGSNMAGTIKSTAFTPDTYTALTIGMVSACTTPSVGGSLAYNPTAVLCPTANTGTITLSGQTGNIVKWQTTTDGGTTWSDISNTTASYTFNNAQNAQRYRAVVFNGGACINAFSSEAVIVTSLKGCVEICDDNIDNDGDGLVDCNDTDCMPKLSIHILGK